MSVVVVISQHLLNVFVQLANKRGFKKKKNFTEYNILKHMHYTYYKCVVISGTAII
jgi:hypothetical protein